LPAAQCNVSIIGIASILASILSFFLRFSKQYSPQTLLYFSGTKGKSGIHSIRPTTLVLAESRNGEQATLSHVDC